MNSSLNQRIEQWLVAEQKAFLATQGDAQAGPRPHVTLSYAQSWDGSITTAPGETLALSSEAGLQMTHQLRSLHDGILVGIGTVLADDPSLTVREWSGSDPQPIVVDSRLRLPPTSRLCQNGKQRCWVVTTSASVQQRSDCELIVTAANESGQVDLRAAVRALYSRGIRTLMVEGGAAMITAFLRAGLVDAIVLTVAPLLVGGYNATENLCNAGSGSFPRITPLFSQQLGDELFMWGRLQYGAAPGGRQ